jgi:hypothetical protein
LLNFAANLLFTLLQNPIQNFQQKCYLQTGEEPRKIFDEVMKQKTKLFRVSAQALTAKTIF